MTLTSLINGLIVSLQNMKAVSGRQGKQEFQFDGSKTQALTVQSEFRSFLLIGLKTLKYS